MRTVTHVYRSPLASIVLLDVMIVVATRRVWKITISIVILTQDNVLAKKISSDGSVTLASLVSLVFHRVNCADVMLVELPNEFVTKKLQAVFASQTSMDYTVTDVRLIHIIFKRTILKAVPNAFVLATLIAVVVLP